MLKNRVRTNDDSILKRLISTLCLQILNLPDDALAIDDLAKHNMFLVQMRR